MKNFALIWTEVKDRKRDNKNLNSERSKNYRQRKDKKKIIKNLKTQLKTKS
jgi:hypothetical protein